MEVLIIYYAATILSADLRIIILFTGIINFAISLTAGILVVAFWADYVMGLSNLLEKNRTDKSKTAEFEVFFEK